MKISKKYPIITTPEGIKYILLNENSDPKPSLHFLLYNDLSTLVKFIENLEHAPTLEYYWFSLQEKHKDYFVHSRDLLFAFVSNPNTPTSVIENLVSKKSKFDDIYLGIEPEVIDMFVNHNNSNEVVAQLAKKNYPDNPYAQQDSFDTWIDRYDHAQQAFNKDPELAQRLSSVKEQHTYLPSQRVKKFNPEDIQAVGADYLMRRYVSLFGAQLDESSGVVTGYIN